MFFKKKEKEKKSLEDIDIAICMLLIHAARTDEKYEDNEKRLIENYFIKLGKDEKYRKDLIQYCEIEEKNSIEAI